MHNRAIARVFRMRMGSYQVRLGRDRDRSIGSNPRGHAHVHLVICMPGPQRAPTIHPCAFACTHERARPSDVSRTGACADRKERRERTGTGADVNVDITMYIFCVDHDHDIDRFQHTNIKKIRLRPQGPGPEIKRSDRIRKCRPQLVCSWHENSSSRSMAGYGMRCNMGAHADIDGARGPGSGTGRRRRAAAGIDRVHEHSCHARSATRLHLHNAWEGNRMRAD
jgi:hypothetical protein